MANLIERWDNVLSHLKFKPYEIRVPTPPQNNDNELDDPGSAEYRFEETRLRSFEGWPSTCVTPSQLAAAGFYYSGHVDQVRCFECSIEIRRWEEGDDPMVEHQRWAGRCRFVRKLPCGNVPIGVDPASVPPRSNDLCGRYGLEYRLSAEADVHHQPELLPSAARLATLGIGVAKRPDFPDYASYEARLKSFEEWPTGSAQTKEQLADAGFYYKGIGDQTTCYHCGGGLKNWEPTDDPWMQHAKWFSTCAYVRLVRGQEFINSVTGRHSSPLSNEETMKMNLPSCIKKVENLTLLCSEKTESQSQSQFNENAAKSDHESVPSINHQQESVPGSTMESNSSASPNNINDKNPIDEGRVCKFCYDEELGIVFLPCGHLVACIKCAPGMTTCAVCRKPVTMTVRAYLS